MKIVGLLDPTLNPLAWFDEELVPADGIFDPEYVGIGGLAPPEESFDHRPLVMLAQRAATAATATALLVALGMFQPREDVPAGSLVGAPPLSETCPPIRPWPAKYARPQFVGDDAFVVNAVTPARGPTTAATLKLLLEAGGQVTYSWSTNLLRSRAGYESRLALVATPREAYDFAAILSDADFNLMQSELVYNQAAARAFAIGLEHEALLVTAPASGGGKTVPVQTTDYSDWMYAGQTALVIAPDNATTATGVVQSFAPASITLDTDVSAAAVPGARIMPTIPSYLDAHQGFGLYPVNVETYALKAHAAYFGNATGDWAPRGAAVTTYTDFFSVTRPVWDRGLVVNGTSPRSAIADSKLVDRGGALAVQASGQPVVDFAREIAFTFANDADRQLLKAFHGAVQGRQKAFLLPTWQPNLVIASGDASGGTIRTKATTDYVGQWSRSFAHCRIQILFTSGTIAYRTITDSIDNGDGTQTLQLDATAAGTIAMVSFLELCRLDSDDIVVQYGAGSVGACRIPCRVVQQ